MFLLASVPEPTTTQVGLWVVIAAFVMTAISVLISVVSVFATKREVEAITTQLRDHADIHKDIFSKLGGMERGLRGEFKAEIDDLRSDLRLVNESVRAVGESVAAANRGAELLNQQIIEARSRIDGLRDKR